MIEIIQETEKTEDKQEAKLPRNIRQIGNPEKDFRIYMEDYVYTYLHPAQLYGCEIGVFPRSEGCRMLQSCAECLGRRRVVG